MLVICTTGTSSTLTALTATANEAGGVDPGPASTISIATSTSRLVPRAGSAHEPSSVPVIAGSLVGCIALVASIMTCIIVHKRQQRHRRTERLPTTSRLGDHRRGLRRGNTSAVAAVLGSVEDDVTGSPHDKLEHEPRSQNSYGVNRHASSRNAELPASISSLDTMTLSSPTSNKRNSQQRRHERHLDNIIRSKQTQPTPRHHPQSHSNAQQSSLSSIHSQTPLLPDPESQVFGPIVGAGLHEANVKKNPDDDGGRRGRVFIRGNRSGGGSSADVLPRIIVTGDVDTVDNNARSRAEVDMIVRGDVVRLENVVGQERDRRGHENQGREEARHTERDLSLPTHSSERPSTSSSGASILLVSSSRTGSRSGSPPPPPRLYSSHLHMNANSSPNPSLLTPSPTLVAPPSPTFTNSSSSSYHYEQERKPALKRIASDVSLAPHAQISHTSINSANNVPGALVPPIPSYSESDLPQTYSSPVRSHPEHRTRDQVYPRGHSNVASRLEEEPPPAYEDHRTTTRRIER